MFTYLSAPTPTCQLHEDFRWEARERGRFWMRSGGVASESWLRPGTIPGTQGPAECNTELRLLNILNSNASTATHSPGNFIQVSGITPRPQFPPM